jgi:CubicO group peptidase (beta-lactamase class C family)
MTGDGTVVLATRRKFLLESSRAVLGLPVVSVAGFLRQKPTPAAPKDSAAPTANWEALITDLEKRLPALLAQTPTVPGVSMALVADAKLLWRGAFGVKDFASKAPVDHGTIFEAASVSKTVFAYAVMKLYEKRLLDLDVPLTRYTPERVLDGDPRLDLITARHTLSHTSGFQNWRTKTDAWGALGLFR